MSPTFKLLSLLILATFANSHNHQINLDPKVEMDVIIVNKHDNLVLIAPALKPHTKNGKTVSVEGFTSCSSMKVNQSQIVDSVKLPQDFASLRNPFFLILQDIKEDEEIYCTYESYLSLSSRQHDVVRRVIVGNPDSL